MCVKMRTTESLVNALENSIDIPEGNHIVIVFKNNDSEDIEGFACVSEEDSGEYPIMSLEELISKYGFKKDKYFESPEHATIPIEIQEMSETLGNYESCDKDVENMKINAKFAIDAYPYPKHRIDLGMGVYEIGPGVFCGKKGLDEFNKAILEDLALKNNVTLKKSKMDKETKELILSWFNHIEQLATDRKTLNGYVMDYQDCLDEIRCISKNSQDFINKHC